uniref:Uncharacterized protein n=1 Tax=Aeromonas hydrophila TaxID=644 RepID=A0A7S5U962_AERHY|nr:Hypothetical protein [Aeromonas hydrophila]
MHNLGLMHQQCGHWLQYGASAIGQRGLCKIPRYRSSKSPLDVGGLNTNPLPVMSGIYVGFSMESEQKKSYHLKVYRLACLSGWGQWPHLVETSASPITTWCIWWGKMPHPVYLGNSYLNKPCFTLVT